jgi:hypothetical protein
MAGSPSLSPLHRLVLLGGSLQILPGPLPPAPASPGTTPVPSGVSVLPPTRWLTTSTVVADDGNVAEPRTLLTATLQPVGQTAAVVVRRRVSLGPGGTVATVFPRMRVDPGVTYVLTVGVHAPAAQADLTGMVQRVTIAIAPSTAAATPTGSGTAAAGSPAR